MSARPTHPRDSPARAAAVAPAVTAALFFDRQPKDLQGEALVVGNCVVVLILLITALRSIGVMGVEIRELQLTFVDDKSVVQLPMLNDEFATHLYISQYWKKAQDQCGVIKSLLLTMLPTCKMYLDEDDMGEEDEIEGQVDQASAVLVFLTSEYVGSQKCMFELVTAYRLRKPLIVVREADSRYGGLSAKDFEAEVEIYLSRMSLGDRHMAGEEQAALAWLQSAAIDGARRQPARYHTVRLAAAPCQRPPLCMQGSSGTARSSSSMRSCARWRSLCTTTRPAATYFMARCSAAGSRRPLARSLARGAIRAAGRTVSPPLTRAARNPWSRSPRSRSLSQPRPQRWSPRRRGP